MRNAPENPGPTEDPVGAVTRQKSNDLMLEEFIFHRASQNGPVMAGDATGTGARPHQDGVVEVTLDDRQETEDQLFDSPSERTTHERLGTGGTWQ